MASRWAAFYDDIRQAFESDPTALRGRRVILDHAGRTQRALGGTPPAQPTLFFSPNDESAATSASRVPADLRALRARIAFTHPGVEWSRPARTFVEENQLVREYRADRVFDALRDLLSAKATDALRRDALAFMWRQFDTLNPSQRAALPAVRLSVPLGDGSWARANTALMSLGWGSDGARRLKRFLDAGGNAVPEFDDLRNRWIAEPRDWPGGAPTDTETYRAFLAAIGVRDGLLLMPLSRLPGDRQGALIQPLTIARESGMDPELAREWAADVAAAGWSGGHHPQTQYAFTQSPMYLPGATAVETLGDDARRQFSELLLWKLRDWNNAAYNSTVLRRTRPTMQQDPHQWPTPLWTFLCRRPWIL